MIKKVAYWTFGMLAVFTILVMVIGKSTDTPERTAVPLASVPAATQRSGMGNPGLGSASPSRDYDGTVRGIVEGSGALCSASCATGLDGQPASVPASYGKLTLPGGQYEGEIHNGKPHGQGVHTYSDGRRYEGEFRDGKYHGQGVMTLLGGGGYEGEYQDGKAHGQGVLVTPDEDFYEGEFRDGKMHGQGVLIETKKGRRYEGEFRDGWPHGQGVLLTPMGNIPYAVQMHKGEFRYGFPY